MWWKYCLFMLGVRLEYVGIRSSVHLTTSLHFKGDLNTQMGGHALCADQTYHSCSLNFEFSSRENLMPLLVVCLGSCFWVQIPETATQLFAPISIWYIVTLTQSFHNRMLDTFDSSVEGIHGVDERLKMAPHDLFFVASSKKLPGVGRIDKFCRNQHIDLIMKKFWQPS